MTKVACSKYKGGLPLHLRDAQVSDVVLEYPQGSILEANRVWLSEAGVGVLKTSKPEYLLSSFHPISHQPCAACTVNHWIPDYTIPLFQFL